MLDDANSFIDQLLQKGTITPDQVRKAKQQSADPTSAGVLDTMVYLHFITPEQMLQAKAEHFGHEYKSLKGLEIPPEVIARMPAHIAQRYKVIPVELKDDSLVVAISDPTDLDTMDSLAHLLHRLPIFCLASWEDINEALKQFYPDTASQTMTK
ncbi:MAG: hypothetical protein AAB629_01485 [Patescibacteria group bacterium]